MTFLWLTRSSRQCVGKISDTLHQGLYPKDRMDETTLGLSHFPLCSPPDLWQETSLMLYSRAIAHTFCLKLWKCLFSCRDLYNVQKLNILPHLVSFKGQGWRLIGLDSWIGSTENKKPLVWKRKAILAALHFRKSTLQKYHAGYKTSPIMWKGMFNWRKESMLSFPQHRRLLMTGMLFSYVEWQKKSQRPLLLFRVSKTVLIKKIAILGDTPLMKTTHGKLISHLCHNRWCLFCDVERDAAAFMNKESCRVWRWRHCFIH